MDDACYEVLDYSWVYNSNIGHSPNRFTTAHRSILHCRKTQNNRFYKKNVAVPYQNPTDKRIKQNLANGSLGRMPYDWFYFGGSSSEIEVCQTIKRNFIAAEIDENTTK